MCSDINNKYLWGLKKLLKLISVPSTSILEAQCRDVNNKYL